MGDRTKIIKRTIIILFAIIGVLTLFLVIAGSIVLDECASPCRNSGEAKPCMAVCDKVTLLDWIFGNG